MHRPVKGHARANPKRLPEGSRSKLKDRTQTSARSFDGFCRAASDAQNRFTLFRRRWQTSCVGPSGLCLVVLPFGDGEQADVR